MTMLENLEPRDWLIAGALLVGLLFGVVGRLSGFCFRSALLEATERRPGRQLAAWLVALPVAVLGTQALALSGLVDLEESIYLSGTLAWGSLVLGGLLFGAGLVTRGLTAYATLRGILALPRLWLAEASSLDVSASGQAVPALLGFGAVTGGAVLAGLLAAVAALTLWRTRWSTPVAPTLAAGGLIGALVPASWYVTGVLAFDDFEPVPLESVTFTAPVGDSLQFLMTYTGATADFGVVVIGGVLLGSFVAALATRSLRAEAFDGAGHLARYLLGGALMGFGGVLALGCTIGAGLSGVSTLSLGSLLAFGAIAAGGLLTQRLLVLATDRATRGHPLGATA